MVNSVLAVSRTREERQEKQDVPYSGSGEKGLQKSFSKMLEQAVNESQNVSVECHTTTYGPDCRLMMFHYKTREYLR